MEGMKREQTSLNALFETNRQTDGRLRAKWRTHMNKITNDDTIVCTTKNIVQRN